MSFRVIKDKESLALFQAETASKIQVELPLEYLQRSRVVALVSRDRRKIHGGFVIAHRGPLRTFEQLPSGWVDNHEYLKARRHRCFEVNGFWLNHQAAHPLARFYLYAACFRQILWQAARGKTNFVYAFDARKQSLERMFSAFNSVRIFHGEVKALPGMAGPAVEIVEICSLGRLVFSAFKNPGFLFLRLNPWRKA